LFSNPELSVFPATIGPSQQLKSKKQQRFFSLFSPIEKRIIPQKFAYGTALEQALHLI
jgi:hypothetical protein